LKLRPHQQKQQHFDNSPSRFTSWRLFVSRTGRPPLIELAASAWLTMMCRSNCAADVAIG